MRMTTALLLMGLAFNANAAFVTYDDRSAWEAALPNGGPDVVEDFEGFTQDTEFRSGPVGLAIGTIGQWGNNAADFRNFIDVTPLDFGDNNGTNHASCFTNAPEDEDPGAGVEIATLSGTMAFGADFADAASGEIVVLAVDSEGQEVTTAVSTGGANEFIGVIATAGERITRIELRSQNVVSGNVGEGFGMDNIGIAFGETRAVPTLGAWSLILMAGLLAFFGFGRVYRKA